MCSENHNWNLKEELFSEKEMYRKIANLCETGDYPQTSLALSFMRDSHEGQYRKPVWFSDKKVPYIQHPLLMACHALALGMCKDDMLAAILLHDVCEDCGVASYELPVEKKVQERVELLTFHVPEGMSEEEAKRQYYQGIQANPEAAMIKIIDRCNNVSTMAASFSRKKLESYVEETEEYIYPLMDCISHQCREYQNVLLVLKYHILSVTETIKNMLFRDRREI